MQGLCVKVKTALAEGTARRTALGNFEKIHN